MSIVSSTFTPVKYYTYNDGVTRYKYSTTGWESIGYMFDPEIFSAWFS